jgi:hypothetical protein
MESVIVLHWYYYAISAGKQLYQSAPKEQNMVQTKAQNKKQSLWK